ncbi:MAG TPA: glycoside hydrolase family 97 catalytic domain-containing protein, partial [Gemmatimonadaceae bacterium]|nr:glycoside hydrolase family 97 catalytic domain-containing protein [Gemmatimonadaceae bacterium]
MKRNFFAALTALLFTTAGWAQDTTWVRRSAIYEVFVRDFSASGDLRGVTSGLDRIAATGANVLWLMPIQPVGVVNRKGTLGSPYALRDYMAIDSAFGTPADFRALVRAVHARGMKIIIDWVPDHTSPDNVWVAQHRDWYVRDSLGAPMVPRNPDGQLTDWTDVVQIDFHNPAARAAMIDAMKWWLREYGIDGFRVDATGFVMDDFWREAVPALRASVPRRILLLAEWGDLKMHTFGFDLSYPWSAYGKLKAVWRGDSAVTFVRGELADHRAMPAGGQRMRFTTNHDETAWDQPPVTLFGGSDGARAAFVAMALLPGRPLIYNGQEVESPQKLRLFERDPVEWDQPQAAAARAFYSRIIQLARSDSAFVAGDFQNVETTAPADVISYRRGNDVVLVNVRNREVRFEVTGAGIDRAGDLLSGRAHEGNTVTLPAYGAVVLAPTRAQVDVSSPDGRNSVTVEIREGRLTWRLDRDGRPLVLPSVLGFVFHGAPTLRDSLRITDTTRASHDEWWTQPWGEVARVHDHHNELAVGVEERAAPNRRFTLRVRAFDDGIGFRYEFPEQPGLGAFEISDELTEFAMADNSRAWWIPSDRPRKDRSEELFSSAPVSSLDSVQTPLTMEGSDGHTFMVIHEANLVDFARMFLAGPRMEGRTLRAALQPMNDGIKVRGHTPFVTPWRTLQVADRVTDLAPSLLGLNLNPPDVLASTDWIHPMKYVGIWWGMHLGIQTWASGPRHGATTENAKRMIDFAAANGFGGVLVEGWNTGWDGDWIANRDAFSFTRSYPDYDLPAVAAYAHQKGVRLIVHNETSGGIQNYERQLDSAFTLYHSLGLDAIKTGYVTDLTTEGHSHYSQYMVQHYRRVIEAAARDHIMVDVHEPMHDTGERRTYPNMMSREGARGQEYNAWSGDGGN